MLSSGASDSGMSGAFGFSYGLGIRPNACAVLGSDSAVVPAAPRVYGITCELVNAPVILPPRSAPLVGSNAVFVKNPALSGGGV